MGSWPSVSVVNQTPYTWHFATQDKEYTHINPGCTTSYKEYWENHRFIHLRYENHTWNSFSYEFSTREVGTSIILRETHDRSKIQMYCTSDGGSRFCPNYGRANGKHGKQWVMLVAGSKSWKNYRHQANVCHAYQIVHQNGIPDEQIMVMMYDDIAYNKKNPYRGNIINKPHGPNVYPGVPKDYTGEDVTAKNFLAALKGDRRAVKKTNPKVITSGENDTIFIYLTDHGNSSKFSFPYSTLYACDLIDTIKEMARKNKFSKMVIYMESCRSGSMLTQLPNNVHVYAVTSTKAEESGYACFLDPERKTYLSDEFSAVWMHYTEMNDLDKKTFRDQFSHLQETKMRSCSCRFGDMTMGEHQISEFLNNTPQSVRDKTRSERLALTDSTSNDEVPFKILEHRIKTETNEDKKQHLKRKHKALHQTKAEIEVMVKAISQHFPDFVLDDLDEDYSQMDLHAFKTVAEHFRTTCFDWHEKEFQIALSHTHVFARLCARGVDTHSIIEAITAVSRKKRVLLYQHP